MKEKTILWKAKKYKYFLRKSKRAKKMKIEIKKGNIFLILPFLVPEIFGKIFLKNKMEWVVDKLGLEAGGEAASLQAKKSKKNFQKYKKEAEIKISQRAEYFAKKYNFSYNKIRIKDNKTNWGSCSAKKNLNFNYRLIFLSDEQMDYIIVHELCHLREMNHSKKFWSEVEKIIPDYKEIRKSIKNIF